MTTRSDLAPGNFFVLGLPGPTVPPSLSSMRERMGLAGTILFDRNVETPDQLQKLTTSLQAMDRSEPLLIAIDQEGGEKQRLKPPHFKQHPYPSHMTLKSARQIGKEIALELTRMGINLDLAPVLDVDTNPKNPIIGKRSFGKEPYQAARIAREFTVGLNQGGVLACGKHFPGHGDTSEDSHLTLPVVDQPLKRLMEVELVPFQYMIGEEIPFLMTAHVVYTALDPKKPATFSSKILQELLRGQLLFEGIVISDDMAMAGALSHADLPDACVEAFAVGCDLLLVCENDDRQEEAVETLGKANEKSNALKIRAMESVERIRAVRRGLKG